MAAPVIILLEEYITKEARSGMAHMFGKKKKRWFRLDSSGHLVFGASKADVDAGKKTQSIPLNGLDVQEKMEDGLMELDLAPKVGDMIKLRFEAHDRLEAWAAAIRTTVSEVSGSTPTSAMGGGGAASSSEPPSPASTTMLSPSVATAAAALPLASPPPAEATPRRFDRFVAGAQEAAAMASGASSFASSVAAAVAPAIAPFSSLLSVVSPAFVAATGGLSSELIGKVLNSFERLSSSCSFVHPVFVALKGLYGLYQQVQQQQQMMDQFTKRLTYWSLVLGQYVEAANKADLGRPFKGLDEFQDAMKEATSFMEACTSASRFHRFLTAGRDIANMSDLDTRLESAFQMMQRDLDVEAKMAQFAFQRLQTQNYQRLQEDVTDIKKKLDRGPWRYVQHPTLQRLWLDSFNYTEIVSITLFCEALRAYVTDMDADVLRRAVDVDGDGMVSITELNRLFPAGQDLVTSMTAIAGSLQREWPPVAPPLLHASSSGLHNPAATPVVRPSTWYHLRATISLDKLPLRSVRSVAVLDRHTLLLSVARDPSAATHGLVKIEVESGVCVPCPALALVTIQGTGAIAASRHPEGRILAPGQPKSTGSADAGAGSVDVLGAVVTELDFDGNVVKTWPVSDHGTVESVDCCMNFAAVLVSNGKNWSVRVLDLENRGVVVFRHSATQASALLRFCFDIAFSPEGRSIVVATRDGVLELYPNSGGVGTHTHLAGVKCTDITVTPFGVVVSTPNSKQIQLLTLGSEGDAGVRPVEGFLFSFPRGLAWSEDRLYMLHDQMPDKLITFVQE